MLHIITIIIVRQSPQVCAIDTDDIDFASMVIAIVIEVGSEGNPFSIWGKGGSLTVASAWSQLTRVRPICIHDKDFTVPRWTGIGDDVIPIG